MGRVASFLLFTLSSLFATNDSILEQIVSILQPACLSSFYL